MTTRVGIDVLSNNIININIKGLGITININQEGNINIKGQAQNENSDKKFSKKKRTPKYTYGDYNV